VEGSHAHDYQPLGAFTISGKRFDLTNLPENKKRQPEGWRLKAEYKTTLRR
jgi:hypothetical protein